MSETNVKNILLCYGYHPNTTAVYFEKALKETGCNVVSITSSGFGKSGYPINVDIFELVSQLPGMKPDLLLFVDSPPFFPRNIEKIDCPTACYLIDTHVNLDLRLSYAPFFDYVFIAQKKHLEDFKHRANSNTSWLPLACDPEIHRGQVREKLYDIGFVGNVRKGTRREKFLAEISKRFSVNDYTRQYTKEQIGEIYSQSRIVFNITCSDDLNMRVFEGLSSGSMLLTERISEGQSDIFCDRHDLVEYADLGEAIALTNYYLAHQEEREEIAANGLRLVLGGHTYRDRCQVILNAVSGDGAIECSAPARSMSNFEKKTLLAKIWNFYKCLEPFADEVCGMGIRGKVTLFPLMISALVRSTGRNMEKMFFRGLFRKDSLP